VKVTAEAADIIYAILQRGQADAVVEAAMAAGAQGATTFAARGTGVRQRMGAEGRAVSLEKEVVVVVTRKGETRPVFDAIISAGRLETPGQGFAFVQNVDQAVGFIAQD
jgi:nitrogen regulatory protein PII